jgi:hypothetical protein
MPHPNLARRMAAAVPLLHDAGRSQMSQALFERAADGMMGCGDACPIVADVRYLDWELSDPNGRPLEELLTEL